MFWKILFIVLIILTLRTIIRVTIYGKNPFWPDFERVDKMFDEKHNVSTNWDSCLGRVVYFVFWLFIVGLILIIIHFV